jgi:16S rRNA (adenine1518-N6/adenine1519-N6)-dimethyltransferase
MKYTDAARLLGELGVTPDRKLGQNFLLNGVTASAIAAESVPAAGGSLLEIGPGLGALTGELLKRNAAVTAVEISRRMSDYLSERFPADRLRMVCADFMKTDPATLPGFPFEVVAGNLPYSISSPVLLRLLEPSFSAVRKAVLMLQREMAVRVAALEGGRDYGRLSLQVWPIFTADVLLDAGSGDFYPRPEVESRVIVLSRREDPLVQPSLYPSYRRMIRISFSSRRKTILNNLATVFGRDGARSLLTRAGIPPGSRAEELAPVSFVRLTEEAGG